MATVTDSSLQEAVLDELKWEPRVNAAHIGVAAKAGIVTLSGDVDSFTEKWAAERAARRVYGVKGIAEGSRSARSMIPTSLRKQSRRHPGMSKFPVIT